MKPARLLLLIFCLCPLAVYAQTAEVGGAVQDPSGAIIPKASVEFRNQDTGVRRQAATNSEGRYHIVGLDPGKYDATVQAKGFKTLSRDNITFQVGDKAQIDFKMQVGVESQTITVDGSGLQINTTDASVSTVVDRKFVENMPLNGRSFQSLILLAPGVVTSTPQSHTTLGFAGEFSINGQRTDANYYSVDGVSANNVSYTAGSSAGSSGGLAASTALGSTQALVSVDALQEFRINTSTYSAEYGRSPGGQIQFETRSGTNTFHGTAFDYLRNSVFDANSWFNNHATPALPRPAERQNDFGGVLGGPLGIPRVYSGKDRAFFFFSYEGLRLSQPLPAAITYVPTVAFRNAVPAALQPVMNAFPLPNCTTAQDSLCVDDSAEGLSPYILSTSLPSSIDAISVRGDYAATSWLRLFFRYSDSKSSAVTTITTSSKTTTEYNTSSYTLGGDATFRGNMSNQFRLEYSPTLGVSTQRLTPLGGGTPVDLPTLQGLPSGIGGTVVVLAFHNETSAVQQMNSGTPQHQWNLVDTQSWLRGRHVFRSGIDYRRTTSYFNAESFARTPLTLYEYTSQASALSNNPLIAETDIIARQDPEFTNFSAFIQDEWKVNSRLSLSLGLRWELNPPPTVVSGAAQYTLNGNLNDPASLTLAPVGTSLYNTTYHNFAPRLGMATTLGGRPGHETLLRVGGGVYYDTGQQLGTLFGAGYGPGAGVLKLYVGSVNGAPISFPLPLSLINLPLSASLNPPYANMSVVYRHFQLPYTYQWNASLEQALGPQQSVTLGYVGSNGRRLIAQHEIEPGKLNPTFPNIYVSGNGLSSSYNALQAQYKRSLSRGLQALASYTWSHAIDFESQDSNELPYERGNSDYDVRNNFTAALSYDLPGTYSEVWKRALFAEWGGDLRFTARTAFPVQIQGPLFVDPNSGNTYSGLLNYDSSVPLYLHQTGVAGGRVVNRAAFSAPLTGQQGNAPRNFVRGFGENEINLAIRREFPIYEQMHLLFRAEAFNILNHPSFGAINSSCGSPSPGNTCTNLTFGQATSTLASSLGGLTPIYQQGGPRSMQFALKLRF